MARCFRAVGQDLHRSDLVQTFKSYMKRLIGQIGSVVLTFTHFRNPLLILMTRLGLIKIPYFIFRFNFAKRGMSILGRPTTTSLADLFVIKEVLLHQTYKDILPLLPDRRIRFVDIGANLGCFSIWLNQLREVSESYCFEPEPDSFRLLNFNLNINGCNQVTPIQAAIGGTPRQIPIKLKNSSPGGTSIYDSEDTEAGDGAVLQRIKVLAFGQWLEQVGTPFDLLKLDCEGAEWEIARRCGQSVCERFRFVVAEVHDDPEHISTVDEFPHLMSRHGFTTLRWDNKSQGIYIGERAK